MFFFNKLNGSNEMNSNTINSNSTLNKDLGGKNNESR